MKVLMLERTFIICFLCNSIVVFLTLYINRNMKVSRGLLFSLIFTVLDILSLYTGYILFAVVLIAGVVISYFITRYRRQRGLYAAIVSAIIVTGLFSILPIKQDIIKWICIGFAAFTTCGFVSQLFINNYLEKTLAMIEMGSSKFYALVDTGIICDNPPIVIVSSDNKDIDIEEIYKYRHKDLPMGTIAGTGEKRAYIVPFIKVNVRKKSAVFFDTTVVITEAKLPCMAIISAMGLV